MSKRTRLNHGKRAPDQEPDHASPGERATLKRFGIGRHAEEDARAGPRASSNGHHRSRLPDRVSERDGSSGSKRQSSVNGSSGRSVVKADGSSADRLVDGRFSNGAPRPAGAGRPPGLLNAVTRQLKAGILSAAERHGSDGKGTDGLDGYLFMLARDEKPLFAQLLKRILPQTLRVDSSSAVNVLHTVRERTASGFDKLIDARPLDG